MARSGCLWKRFLAGLALAAVGTPVIGVAAEQARVMALPVAVAVAALQMLRSHRLPVVHREAAQDLPGDSDPPASLNPEVIR
jgi:hypothetical protein